MLPYIGPEFVATLMRSRSVAEKPRGDEAIAHTVPNKHERGVLPEGTLRVTLLKLFIVTFQLATRWLM